MKRRLVSGLAIVSASCLVVVYVLAQQPAPARPPAPANTLAEAIALLTNGKAQEAKDLIASIDKGSPEYGSARCYLALCRYDLKDDLGFLKELESPEVKEARMPAKIKEDIAFKEIEVLFRYRRFEDLFPRIKTYENESKASPRFDAVVEYQLAALFDRGMKKAGEATRIGEPDRFAHRWSEARSNLLDFVELASKFKGNNYKVVTKRALKEELWSARMTLGDEEGAFAEVPPQDKANREKLKLLRTRLYTKLQPDNVDQNLQMMADFIQEFPESDSRPRVEMDIASVAFHQGERLSKNAVLEQVNGGTNAAIEMRAAARRYFALARPLQARTVENKDLGIEQSDIRELHEGLLASFYWEGDYASLSAQTTSMIEASQPGDENWLRAKLFDAAALARQQPPQLERAVETFDEILALGFKNKPAHDRYPAMAARWRVNLALRSGDEKKAREIAELMASANCTKNIKETFLQDHASLVAQGSPTSK